MKGHEITALILLAALACYLVGFGASAAVFLVLGGALELWFWLRLIRGKPQTSSGPPAQ